MENEGRISIPRERYLWALHRAGQTEESYMSNCPASALPLWLSGAKAPTAKQLETFAKQLHVPMGYLFLRQVPREEMPFPLFRGSAGRYDHFDLNVYDTVCAVQQRQAWLEDYLRDNDIAGCSLVRSVTLRTPVAETVRRLRAALPLAERWTMDAPSVAEAIRTFLERLEESGVFVVFNGVVGNDTHRPLEVEACRGFSLVSERAPYIFVNSRDAKTAQLFTLAHEMSHLMLGMSAGHAAYDDPVCDEAEERYCDRVAAELLVPTPLLRTQWDGDVRRMANKFRVSEPMMARRLYGLNLLSAAAYRQFWAAYNAQIVPAPSKGSGGSFWATSGRRIGKTFAAHLRNAVRNHQISYTEAYRLTGLRGGTFDKFMTQ